MFARVCFQIEFIVIANLLRPGSYLLFLIALLLYVTRCVLGQWQMRKCKTDWRNNIFIRKWMSQWLQDRPWLWVVHLWFRYRRDLNNRLVNRLVLFSNGLQIRMNHNRMVNQYFHTIMFNCYLRYNSMHVLILRNSVLFKCHQTIIHYIVVNGLRYASGPVIPSHPLHKLHVVSYQS